jgi:hypothetical protein
LNAVLESQWNIQLNVALKEFAGNANAVLKVQRYCLRGHEGDNRSRSKVYYLIRMSGDAWRCSVVFKTLFQLLKEKAVTTRGA